MTLSGTSVSGTYGDMTFENGIAAFILKHGESRTASGLPAGVAYTAAEQEADQDGYTTTVTGGTGTIKENQTAAAVFTNTRESTPPSPGTPDTPGTPNQPVQPGNSGQLGNSGQSGNSGQPGTMASPDVIPKTGDTADLALWLTLLAVSGAGLTAALIFGRKKQNRGKHIK